MLFFIGYYTRNCKTAIVRKRLKLMAMVQTIKKQYDLSHPFVGVCSRKYNF